MPRFSLDENVTDQALPTLVGLGVDAVSTTQLGLKGATDPRQLLTATRLGRVLVTHNASDFRMLHEALALWAERWGVRDAVLLAGILIIVQSSGMKASVLANVIHDFARLGEPTTSRLFVWNLDQGFVEETSGSAANGRGADAPRVG